MVTVSVIRRAKIVPVAKRMANFADVGRKKAFRSATVYRHIRI